MGKQMRHPGNKKRARARNDALTRATQRPSTEAMARKLVHRGLVGSHVLDGRLFARGGPERRTTATTEARHG